MSTLWLTDGRPSISARDGGEGGKRQDFESKKIFCPPPDPPPRAAPAAAAAAADETLPERPPPRSSLSLSVTV